LLLIEFGYDPYTTKLYRDHNGSNPRNPANGVDRLAGRAPQANGKIANAVKVARQEKSSLSPHAPNFAYQKYLQDWTRWVNLGLVDESSQVYRQDLAALKVELYNGGFRPLPQLCYQRWSYTDLPSC